MRSIKKHFDSFITKVSPVKFFLCMALLFGPIFIAITPPFESPDEQIHFFRAYHVSGLNLTLDKSESSVGGFLPRSLLNTVNATFVHPASPGYVETKYDAHKIISAAAINTEPQNVRFYDLSATGLNPPTTYLPQATGIAVARAFEAPPIAMMYSGRLFNMIAWAALCALAVHLIPRKKWAIVFLALMPMSFFQAVSLSADVTAIGSLIIFFAYILKLKDSSKQLTRKQLILLLIAAILMAMSKQSMFIFLPLVLLLPDKLFPRKRLAYLSKSLLIIIPLIFWASWLLLNLNRDLNQISAYSSGTEQIKFMVLNPHSYINVLWNTYFFSWGDTITKSFMGTFGWVNVPLSAGIVVMGYISMTLILLMSTNKKKLRSWLTGRQKLLVGSIAILYWLSLNSAMYIFNSPAQFKIIVGLQGRYFLPVAILLVPLLYGNWLRTTKIAYRYIAIFAPTLLLSASAITIYVRYYVNNV